MKRFLLNLKFIFNFIIYILGELLSAFDGSWILIGIGIVLMLFFPIARIILLILFILYLIKNKNTIVENIKIEKGCMINEYKTFFEEYENKRRQKELFDRIHKEAKIQRANLNNTAKDSNNTTNCDSSSISPNNECSLFSSNIYSDVNISNNNNIKTFDYSVNWNITKCDLPIKIVRVIIKDIPARNIAQVVTIAENGTQDRISYKGAITIEDIYNNLVENN
ncbi:hypothetical protein [Clostridium baratii]|uniref:hypothetical protein n=1 Tax=Clostridium baratii TaxID=1561 RepID=UPI0005F2E2B6|nr:hypothetical protein [Clostridium baratii]AQM58632.1 hypothetical protein NPD11_3037 [Clostridium baratii]KJU71553.1 hypothetical protein UC77_09065 [Clostridium baratii]